MKSFEKSEYKEKTMKTLVEIVDQEMILNFLTGYREKPENVIFLYEPWQTAYIHNTVIEKYLEPANITYRCFTKKTLPAVLEDLEADTAYDIHGGNGFAIAMVSQKAHRDKAVMYYPDQRNGIMFTWTNQDVLEEKLEFPHLSVKEMTQLHGGDIRPLKEVDFTKEEMKVVHACLEAKHPSTKRWGQFCRDMGEVKKDNHNKDVWKMPALRYEEYKDIFAIIKNMFSSFTTDGEYVYFKFTNKDFVTLITDMGVSFEYCTYEQLTDAQVFDDVDIRVNIDWNGNSFEPNDPNSEIDVMATKDARLFCISCKAGKYDEHAIYEVKTNADRFGGDRCVPVLCTDLEENHIELVKKAEELGVLLIEHQDMWDHKAAERILEWIKTH